MSNSTAIVSQNYCEASDSDWLSFKRDIDSMTVTVGQGHHRVGVALIGVGRMGLIHLRNVLREPKANLLYLFETDPKRLESFSKSMLFTELKVQVLSSDQFDRALEDPKVHAVIVATPTSFHEQYTRRALEAGKNVLCEKPLTTETEKIMTLYELAKKKRVFLLCAFNRRYDPHYRQLRARSSDTPNFGSIQVVKLTSRDCGKPPLDYLRTSSGMFHDTCIHDFDACLWFMRQLPVSIQVMGRTWKEYYNCEEGQLTKMSGQELKTLRELDDYFLAIITMKFLDGSICVIDNSREVLYGFDQRCEIYGAKATINLDGRPVLNTTEYSGDGILNSTMPYTFASRYRMAYLNEIHDMTNMCEITLNGKYDDAAVVKEKLMEPIRPTLIVASHTIADACVKASKTGNTVTLDWDQNLRKQFAKDIQLD